MKKLLLPVLLTSFLLSGCVHTQTGVVTVNPQAQSQSSLTQTVMTPLEAIPDGKIEFKPGESALDILKRTHTVILKHYSFGDIADTIDGTAGGTGGRYWIFYVNGKQSTIGAGAYVPKSGDVIIWKFQKESENL